MHCFISSGNVCIEVRHDEYESKLVKEETNNKILYQLDASAKTARSGGHADSPRCKALVFAKRGECYR